MKQIPVPELIEGKRLMFVDDSIVRGTQLRETVEFLYEHGAKEVHMRISSPPFLNPCYYGTDIDSKENLIACHHSISDIATMIGVDSLGYLPIDKLSELVGNHDYCSACFDGNYPTTVPSHTNKSRFESKLSERKDK